MGGIAFKDSQGKSLASGVERQYVQDTLDDLFKNHLKDAGVLGYEPVGSTGKKSIAGDLDIAVQPTQQDIKLAKTQIYRNLLGLQNWQFLLVFPVCQDRQGFLAG